MNVSNNNSSSGSNTSICDTGTKPPNCTSSNGQTDKDRGTSLATYAVLVGGAAPSAGILLPRAFCTYDSLNMLRF